MMCTSRFQRAFLASFIGVAMAATSLVSSKEPPPRNHSSIIERGGLPYRVHVIEDYETEIERRWWLRGKPEEKNLPASHSKTLGNHRCSRASETKDFDRKMGDATKTYKAVIFNPVPGPPMGKNTRLGFRYWLKGTDRIRVQIYSLSNNYHRHLVLTGLPQGRWQEATVDMTAARRPDGSGGPLSENERIDDIQFYISPQAELLIDDIILYDAAVKGEKKTFPRRPIFTAWFDTGKLGKEWPGDFEIVLHEKPLTWDAACSVVNEETRRPWLRVSMRGQRPLGEKTQLRFRYRLAKAEQLKIELVDSKTNKRWATQLDKVVHDHWTETSVTFSTSDGKSADEIRFLLPAGGELLVDDLLLYEP